MVLVCLPSDALLQHLPSYLGFFYLGHGVSLHGCSSKAQLLLLTLEQGYLLTAAPPDERLLLNDKTPGFLASRGDEFNLGPEMRLDCSELLCNKVLLKYKGDRESF